MNDFLKDLKFYRHIIPKKTLKTIRGQALAGDVEGARKGLETILRKSQSNKEIMKNAHRSTRYMMKQYKDINYNAQLAICLSKE